jgi:predicted HicB family RNase H-like nuclease
MTNSVIEVESAVVETYLKRPYTRLLVPEDDGTFRAEILEFPGCIATGDTAVEALASLDSVSSSWLMAVLSRKQTVPEPMDNHDFSGRVVARFPKSLHKKATRIAEIEGVSLNQLIVTSLAQYVGEKSAVKTQASVSVNALQLFNFQSFNAGWQTTGTWSQTLQLPFNGIDTLTIPKGTED